MNFMLQMPSLGFFSHLCSLGLDFVDVANEVESLFGKVIQFASKNLVETTDGFLELHVLAGHAGEDLGHKERLRKEFLDFARTVNGAAIVL